MRELSRRLVTLLVVAVMVNSTARAEDKKLPPAATKEIDYAQDIDPILKNNCIKCHGPNKQKSNLRLDSREAALKGGDIGKPIVVGKSAESNLIKYVAGLDEETKMPPTGDPLTEAQIGLLRAWIDQ